MVLLLIAGKGRRRELNYWMGQVERGELRQAAMSEKTAKECDNLS